MGNVSMLEFLLKTEELNDINHFPRTNTTAYFSQKGQIISFKVRPLQEFGATNRFLRRHRCVVVAADAMPTINFACDFGWLMDNVIAMSEAEIASELGLRYRKESLLFTVWAPGLEKSLPPSPLSVEMHVYPPVPSRSSSASDTVKSLSSSTASINRTPPISPPLSPVSVSPSPPPSLPLPVDTLWNRELPETNNSTACPKDNRVSEINKESKDESDGKKNIGQVAEAKKKLQNPAQTQRTSLGAAASFSSAVVTGEAVQKQEQHEQWQKVIHARRPGGGAAGAGRGGGGAPKIKPLIPGLVGGRTNVSYLAHPKGRGHFAPNYRRHIQQGAGGQKRQGVNLNGSVPASGSTGAQSRGNIHGKPQQISVITANRNRTRKNKNNNVAFDNGLKFRL